MASDSSKDKEEDCFSVNSGQALTSADQMRFTSLTYEIIEELRMRRKTDAENEKKIQHLIQDKFTMDWKLDQECTKMASMKEQHDSEICAIRRQLEEQMRHLHVEISKQQVYRNIAEKEKDALKEEVRKLQVANYSLEKKVRESDHQEKIFANERDQHIKQMSKFESEHSQIESIAHQLTAKQDKLDKDSE